MPNEDAPPNPAIVPPLDFGASYAPMNCPKHGRQVGRFVLRIGALDREYCPSCIIELLDRNAHQPQ
jgi:hypothetical protein